MSEELTITATEASRSFSEMLSRVAYSGESFVITKGKRIMARITPVDAQAEAQAESANEAVQPASQPLKSLPPELIPDFSQTPSINDAEYYEAVLEELGGQSA